MQSRAALDDKKWGEARRLLATLLESNPEPWVRVEIAAAWCLEGRADKAFEELQVAIEEIARDPLSAGPMVCTLADDLSGDDRWKGIRSDARFASLLARAKEAEWRPEALPFDLTTAAGLPLTRRPLVESSELKQLRETYRLDVVVAGASDQLELVKRMCHWVHSRTSHGEWNAELPEDVPALLKAAERGSQWQCVQFGRVLTECLRAVGIPARTVAGRARDVETILYGAGHVFTEAWLEDRRRWIFIDPQMDLLGVDRDGTPLNAVEFRNALARPEPLCEYPACLSICMHYFLYGAFDGTSTLMVGPIGTKAPAKFQRQPRAAPGGFTHRVADAYAAPADPASAQAAVESNANLRDFDFLTEKIRRNYAGWDHKVTDETRPELDALTARLRAEAATATPLRLGELLKEWTAFFKDGHLGVATLADDAAGSVQAAVAPPTPTRDWSEASVRAQIDALGAHRDPLEGIWNIAGDRYRVGVLREPGSTERFSAVVLSTKADNWKPGEVKAELERAADGSLSMLFRAGDHFEHRSTVEMLLDGAAIGAGKWGRWSREYPASPDPGLLERAFPSDQLFLKPLSATTMWLRLPDFDASRAQPVQELLAAHERKLASYPNLVIDLRDNGGGSDSVYGPIIPLLYTRPIYTVGVEILASADNIALLKELADELRARSPDIADGLERRIARLERNVGGFVQNSDRPFSIQRLDAVRAFPKRVAILIDGAGSSGEQFLLEARQSRKVTLFGKENSAGVLDFANLIRAKTPSGRHVVFWPTSRTLRLPDEPVDPDGIAPDIRIPADVADPVGFAQAWLERQVDGAETPAAPRTVKLRQRDGSTRDVRVPGTPAAWSALARTDVEAAYEILANNHPGIADPRNPAFPKLLAEARQNALELVPRVDGPRAYEHVLARFRSTLQDGHAGPFARLPDEIAQPRRWPGFLATWRGEAMLVHHSERAEVPVGSRVLSCDGQPVDALLRERVFAFEHGLHQPGRWWLLGGGLLLDNGNPFLAPLARCEIETSEGQRREVALDWRELPEGTARLQDSVTNGDPLPIGLHWQEERWPWIAMPTFQPDEAEAKAYEDTLTTLVEQRERLLKAPAIVLDLRGNQGGDSMWPYRIAQALWGEGRVDRRREAQFAKTQVWWRASPGNTVHAEAIAPEIGAEMRAALARGEPFVKLGAEDPAAPAPGMADACKDLDSDPPPLTAPVFVIVPPQCASAGLDAIDYFKLFPNTRLLGAPSSADSTYMDIRVEELPSGLGRVVIPNKVYIDRPRGNGEHYAPDILHADLDWSTERFLRRVQAATAKPDGR